jgi:hypothetical protein
VVDSHPSPCFTLFPHLMMEQRMKWFRWPLRIVVIAFLVWMAIDLAPRLVPSLNSLTATDLEVYTEKARRDLAQAKAALSATTEASPVVPRDLSRVERFKRLPKLAEKNRSVWIKELGSPTESGGSIAGVPPGGIDCWRTGGVDMIVTWLKDTRPLGIMFTCTKGNPELTTEEIAALQQYFARFRPTATNGMLVVGINKEP